MGQNWEINPNTKDYVMQGGAPVETNSLRIPAYFRLKIKRTKWLYAPNNQYGSDFYLVEKRRASQDATFFENLAAAALQPIVDDGRASAIDATVKVAARYGIGMDIKIEDAGGAQDAASFEGLGV